MIQPTVITSPAGTPEKKTKSPTDAAAWAAAAWADMADEDDNWLQMLSARRHLDVA